MRANSAAVSVSQLTRLLLEDPEFRTIAASVDSRTLWYTLYDLTSGEVEIDFYLGSSLGEDGEYVEQRSEIFSFVIAGKLELADRVGLEVA